MESGNVLKQKCECEPRVVIENVPVDIRNTRETNCNVSIRGLSAQTGMLINCQ